MSTFFSVPFGEIPEDRRALDYYRHHQSFADGTAMNVSVAAHIRDMPLPSEGALLRRVLDMAVNDRSRNLLWHGSLDVALSFDINHDCAGLEELIAGLHRLAYASILLQTFQP